VQVTFSAAAVNISNASLGVVALTGLPRGAWSTLEFTVPATVRAALLGDLPRASFSLIMNTPNGAQPLLLDNLRFSGTQTARTVFHQVAKADGVSSNALFSFETLSDWSSPQGGLSLASQNVLQGTSALSIPALGYSQIRSRNFATSELSGVTSKLSLGVFVPSNQPTPSAVGSVQAYFSCPSAGINSLYLGQASLANTFFGEYNQLTFSLPANVVSALKVSHTDFQITLALNVTASSSQYLFDDLGFVAP